jgi:catalase
MYIPLNNAAYSPNTLNEGSPRQANQTTGRGFFTAPNRGTTGKLMRALSSTFADVWSQPRLFYNSLLPVEQQFLINAMRFETSQLQSDVVKRNVLIQLNRVSHDIATRVATALGMAAPEADPTYYHDNKTIGVSVARESLLKIDGLRVGYLASTTALSSSGISSLRAALDALQVDLVVVAELLSHGVNQTYSTTDAGQFDAIIVGPGVESLFLSSSHLANSNSTSGPLYGNSTSYLSTLYPPGRPLQILQDGYRWGKPVAAIGAASSAFEAAGIASASPGVYTGTNVDVLSRFLQEGLRQFKFLDRYPLDQ